MEILSVKHDDVERDLIPFVMSASGLCSFDQFLREKIERGKYALKRHSLEFVFV